MSGLYLHIPFCLRKCHYCDFVITTDRSLSRRERFLQALEQEIAWAQRRYGTRRFDTFYLGGGTPSLLEEIEFRKIFDLVGKAFEIDPEAEITCELNPEDAQPAKLELLKALGVNRVSVGIQSLSDRLLQEMGRAHNAFRAREALALLYKIGFRNVSTDLILRLPGQSVEDVASSLGELIGLGVSQVVLYDLDVHERTVYGLRQREGRLSLPPEEIHRQMAEEAEKLLERAGYLSYEVSSFAKPGFESRHNLIYWRNREYLGLGPGAFSYMDGTRYQLARDVPRYLEKCGAGSWEPDEAEVISPENREIETLLTGLRLREGVGLGTLILLRLRLEEILPAWIEPGWIERMGNHIRLTRRGRFVAERVIGDLVTACLALV